MVDKRRQQYLQDIQTVKRGISKLDARVSRLKKNVEVYRARTMQESTSRDPRSPAERIRAKSFFIKDLRTGEKDIEVIYVASSNLNMVSYSASRRVMHVKFKSGSAYNYFAVPPHIMILLSNASSKGRYHYYNVRMSFAYQRVH